MERRDLVRSFPTRWIGVLWGVWVVCVSCACRDSDPPRTSEVPGRPVDERVSPVKEPPEVPADPPGQEPTPREVEPRVVEPVRLVYTHTESMKHVHLISVDPKERQLWYEVSNGAYDQTRRVQLVKVDYREQVELERVTVPPEVNYYTCHSFDAKGKSLADGLALYTRAVSQGDNLPWATNTFSSAPLRLSPDGKRLIYHASDHLFLSPRPPDGSGRRIDTTLKAAYQPVWSPDGRYVAFSACDGQRIPGQPVCWYKIGVGEPGHPVLAGAFGNPSKPLWTGDSAWVLATSNYPDYCLWAVPAARPAETRKLQCFEHDPSIARTVEPFMAVDEQGKTAVVVAQPERRGPTVLHWVSVPDGAPLGRHVSHGTSFAYRLRSDGVVLLSGLPENRLMSLATGRSVAAPSRIVLSLADNPWRVGEPLIGIGTGTDVQGTVVEVYAFDGAAVLE